MLGVQTRVRREGQFPSVSWLLLHVSGTFGSESLDVTLLACVTSLCEKIKT
jgi:hypothetical protein